MAKVQVYRNDYAVISARHEDKYIQVTWLQHIDGEPLRNILCAALQHARTNELTRWLCDLRRLNYTTIADQNWVVKEFFPSFDFRFRHRIGCVANADNVERHPDTLINAAMKQSPVLSENLQMKTFLDMELAEYWLYIHK